VVAIFERIADGQTPGAVARWLNDQGVRSLRGALFTQRTIRKVIANDAYLGQKGYPRIVSDDLAGRARSQLVRLDPAEVQRRKGGRRPHEPYLLRSLAFCAGCGQTLYRSHAYMGRQRTYVCRNKLEATGACDRPPIPASVLEAHVLNHLSTFVGSVEAWLREKAAERTAEQRRREVAVDGERRVLDRLDAELDRAQAEYRSLLAEGNRLARYALEVVEQIDREREAQERRIAEAEAVLAEWASEPHMDAALDFYNEIADAVQGRIGRADGIRELNEALSGVLAGLWCEVEKPRHRLLVEFRLRVEPETRLPDGSRPRFESGLWLPPVSLDQRAPGGRGFGNRAVEHPQLHPKPL